jgi:flagellar FliJ protein
MPKFVFPLEAVLRHREHVERERQRELAVAQAEMSRLQDELKAVTEAMHAGAADMNDNHLTGSIDVNYLTAHRRYTVAMQRRGVTIVQDMARQQKKVDESQRLLAEAARERKIIEKLRETQHERWKAEVAREEAAQLDEVAMQMTYRREAITADNQDVPPRIPLPAEEPPA